VPLIERNEPCDQRLVLAPIPKGNEETQLSLAETSEPEHPKYHLDLRLWYPNKPEEEEISSLARRLRKLMIDDGIGASRIGWLGLKNRKLAKSEKVRQVADAWISKIRPTWSPFVGSYPESDITSSDIERCISSSSELRIKESIITPPAPTQNRCENNATSLTKHASHSEDEKKGGSKGDDKPSKNLLSKPRDASYRTPGSTRGILPFLIGGAAFGFIWTFFR
jgi:hypothetical protein